MHLIIGVFALVCVFIVAPLWRRYKLRRANTKFQRSIWAYDEARYARPTAEEKLYATGFGSQVRNIERIPRPDPPSSFSVSPPTSKPSPAPKAAVPAISHFSSTPIATRPTAAPVPLSPASRHEAPAPLRLYVASPPSRPLPLPDRKVVPPLPKPPEPIRLATIQPTGPSLQYEMAYATEWGEVTERRIRLKRVYSEHGEVYVEAHCYLRREQRTFRVDRMSDLVEADSDTPIADPLAHFLGFIEPEEIVTPGHELVMARARPGLFAMVWISRAGGDLDPETIAVLSAFCADRARMNRGATDFNVKLAERWIADQRPTFEIASGSLARMKRGGPEWQMVHERAREIVKLRDVDKRTKRLNRLFKA